MIRVLCAGCFDIFHYGHLLHLQAARALGDELLVALTSDRFVNKGPGRPVHTWDQRAAVLMGQRAVSGVFMSDAARPDDVIRQLQPQIYAKGIEYQGRLPEQALVESLGGRVVFTDTPKFSSTALVEHLEAA